MQARPTSCITSPSLAVIGVRFDGLEVMAGGADILLVFKSSFLGRCFELDCNEGEEGGSFFTIGLERDLCKCQSSVVHTISYCVSPFWRPLSFWGSPLIRAVPRVAVIARYKITMPFDRGCSCQRSQRRIVPGARMTVQAGHRSSDRRCHCRRHRSDLERPFRLVWSLLVRQECKSRDCGGLCRPWILVCVDLMIVKG